VSKLPTHLVKAFRSTLEEAREADLLLHVVDVSNDEYRYMMDVTNETLQAVGVKDVPTLELYNKADLADINYPRVSGNSLWVSAKDGKGLDELLEIIRANIFADYKMCRMLIPYERGDIVSYLNEQASVQTSEYEEEGTLLKVELKLADYERFQEFILGK
ncbi:MAG TPA: GTPase HflX, partial [Paenisporosarcina sp.]|nr:GTPase HflX [Paenisporosarcina sp.]